MAKTKEEQILYDKAYYQRNKKKRLLQSKAYYEQHKEEQKSHKKIWYNNHYKQDPKYYLAKCNKRRGVKLQRTPTWLTKEQLEAIKQIYKNCPSWAVVDHIIPLQGRNVSGLHVPWNLQYLTPEENKTKSNKHESDGE